MSSSGCGRARRGEAVEPEVHRESADPEQPVEGVAHAQRLELPGLLEQPLHGTGEAQDRDHQEEDADDAEARARARRAQEDVPDRFRAAAGELVAVDDVVGGVLAPQLGGEDAGDDRQRDHGRQGEGETSFLLRHNAVDIHF